ncbi:superoxide dismutase, Ni [Candidatus Microgenomates bacterium]|nr:superoxide dismutase, Ni [Candidatus Microgenomates bacterium]
MLQSLLRVIDKISPSTPVYAHCDIPCGIYDPHNAQMGAHTIVRMVNLLDELQPSKAEPDFEERKRIISQISRLTKVKEEHAEMVKKELRVLWADYFKEEHLKDYPTLHDTFWRALKLASKARQEISIEAAKELLEQVQKIAEIFWKTKGMEPVRISSGYPTEGEIVSHK